MMEQREMDAREAARRARRNVTWFFAKEENRRFYRKHMEVKDVDWLVAAAWEGNKDALQMLREYARGVRKHPQMLVSANFLALVLECFIDGPPQAKPGVSPLDTGLTYQTVAILIRIVNQDYGFPLHHGPVTAIRIVAEELGLSESRVLKIWEEWGNNLGGQGEGHGPETVPP
jgi:hypothetical protein